ncbi:sodium:solute symporter family transporter [Salmonella enterica]|uniref:sodium:solute symporter family transporter n=1 Tax=Salmonella enterica TaxID=28901 RepID=UPI000F047038|nr:sodium/solute symporter [Salmonella enterica]
MAISTPMLVTFCVYIFGMILIGFIAWRSTKNFDDYILGGRSLGPFVTALSAGASDMSGWLLMGLPGAIFLSGISESWIAIGLTLGAWINWKLVAGRLRVHTEFNNNALTLPDYFTGRFEDKSRVLRIISALVILLFFTIYCASGIVAGARLFESTFGMSYETALWAGAAATIIYTFIGGFLAVSWTDTVQASLMIFALILTPVMVIVGVGGFSESLEVIKQKSIENVDMLKGLNFVAIISLMGWGLGYFGQPHILARFMAADSHHRFIELAQILFNPWIAGVLLSAILAAVMSTLSCQLLVCSSAITEDLYKAFLRKSASQQELVWVGRVMVLVVALIAIALAANPDNRVLGLVSYAWAGFGAAFGPVVLFSVMWSRMTRNGALAGMIIGAVTVIVWKQYGWLDLYEIIPGFIFGSLGIVIFSLLGKAPTAAMQERFAKADAHYHSAPPSKLQAE